MYASPSSVKCMVEPTPISQEFSTEGGAQVTEQGGKAQIKVGALLCPNCPMSDLFFRQKRHEVDSHSMGHPALSDTEA